MNDAIHINAPVAAQRSLRRQHCPTCNKRSWFARHFYEWYGWNIVCLRCGDQWHDGERGERPFVRGWRKKAVAEAIRQWRSETNGLLQPG